MDEREAAGCLGKPRFPNGGTAHRVAARTGLTAYRCVHCGGWHLGLSQRPRPAKAPKPKRRRT